MYFACLHGDGLFLRSLNNHTFLNRKGVYLFGTGAWANRLHIKENDDEVPSDFIYGVTL
jgi:hypothetical protein